MTPCRFRSFAMGGFEGSTHRRRDRRRVDTIASSAHDRLARQDYALVRQMGIATTREALADRYALLMKRLYHDRDTHGIGAGIYTQLTDVEETTPAIQASLESFLHELVGEEVPVTHRWAGIFGLTQDMLPLVGPVPGRDGRVWVAGGYSGHGNVLGFACGELVADAILGRESPQLELLAPERFEG